MILIEKIWRNTIGRITGAFLMRNLNNEWDLWEYDVDNFTWVKFKGWKRKSVKRQPKKEATYQCHIGKYCAYPNCKCPDRPSPTSEEKETGGGDVFKECEGAKCTIENCNVCKNEMY